MTPRRIRADPEGPDPDGVTSKREREIYEVELARNKDDLGLLGRLLGRHSVEVLAILAGAVLEGLILIRANYSKDGDFVIKVTGYILAVVSGAVGIVAGSSRRQP